MNIFYSRGFFSLQTLNSIFLITSHFTDFVMEKQMPHSSSFIQGLGKFFTVWTFYSNTLCKLMLFCWTRAFRTHILDLAKESLLAVCYDTHKLIQAWSKPDPQATLNKIAENTCFSVLNWLRNQISAMSDLFSAEELLYSLQNCLLFNTLAKPDPNTLLA